MLLLVKIKCVHIFFVNFFLFLNSIMSLSGLELTGSLSVTQNATDDVGTSMQNTIALQEVNTARPTATSTATAAYYIKVVADINASITFHPSDGDSNEDDAWSMASLSYNNTDDAAAATLKLPTASNVSVDAGLITANHDGGSGTFPVTLTVSANDQGVLSSSIAISGDSIVGSKDDDYGQAQQAYWPINEYSSAEPTALGDTDADVLTASLSAANFTTHYATELAAINAQYNTAAMVSSWTLAVSLVAQATESNLSNHARANSKTDANVFAAGDKIVAASPYSYSVAINDYTGSANTIVSATEVYGIVEQSA